MTTQSFDNLMLIGRAAAGKSELIDFLKHLSEADRLEKYHIGAFEEVDDFPWLYQMWQDEDLWEKLGRKRTLATKRDNVYLTLDWEIYDFTILKFNREIEKKQKENPDYYNNNTLFVEYARGQADAYKKTLNLFEKDVLERTAIFYLDNTFEESMRRNTIRATDKDTEQTILHHRTPLEVMEHYYKINDWQEFTEKKPHGFLDVHGVKVPFVTVWNMPETLDFNELEKRYGPALDQLWRLYVDKPL
jgi:hypothetical protein